MKKVLILFVAVMLALPAMSYAGSVDSRWDLTIGGMVKLDVQWANQTVNPLTTFAERDSGTWVSARASNNSLTWGAGETRLNFLVKGPDTWGAKTSAFIEGDFARQAVYSQDAATRSEVESYGSFGLRHAFMKFDWPTFSIVAGQTWSVPGVMPCFCLLTTSDFGVFNKGYFVPEIYGVWQATKTFSVTAGVMSPYDATKGVGGTPTNGVSLDQATYSSIPDVFAELNYKTDSCGKIGPWMLQFGLGGLWGREKDLAPSSFGGLTSSPASNFGQFFDRAGYDSSNVQTWLLTFKTYIPIIPEKAPGKLAHSLGFAGSGFTGQNARELFPPSPFFGGMTSYNRAYGNLPSTYLGSFTGGFQGQSDYHAPVVSGGWGELFFYWTDTLWSGFYYGQAQIRKSAASSANTGLQNGFSTVAVTSGGNGTTTSYVTLGDLSALANAPITTVDKQVNYVVNLIYDPNPAVRLGIEYSYIQTHYPLTVSGAIATSTGVVAIPANALKNSGNLSVLHFAAQYFF
ncbi:MAG TPA: hypothetical protein VKF36_15385 [Syntrophorhabdales bacterium]|nr:hypothetical protein [Syntrophorhabdales bacterium]